MMLVHWPLMDKLLHLVQRLSARRGLGGAAARPGPHSLYTKCNSPPITDQCTNHSVVLMYNGPLDRWCAVLLCPQSVKIAQRIVS